MLKLPCFEKYIGIPYKGFGRDFDGCDCWGLLRLVYLHELKIEIPSYLTYLFKWNKILTDEEKPFDAISIRVMNKPLHVGLVVRKGKMLHTTPYLHSSCIEDYLTDNWRHRIVGFYRSEGL